jgi:RNA polymerase sigma factor (sigma-70 family)
MGALTGHRAGARRLRRFDDARLAALVREGDQDAFEALYDRHHASLLAFCRHMLGNREDGEDALQQTFLRAHHALRQGRLPDAMRPWLFAIARNRCRTLLAARRDAALPADDLEPSSDGLADDVQRRSDLRELVGDLGRLPEDQRGALVLFELGDLNHSEIASVLGCAPGKVKALVFQARAALIAERDARATPCTEIRDQLEVARGGLLRRGPLRRHLRECAPCDAYRLAVARQRSGLALVLPVAPTAGLKAAVLAGAGTSGSGGAVAAAGSASVGAAASAASATGGGAAATAGGLAVKALVAKVAVTAAVAGAGVSGGVVALDDQGDRDRVAGAGTGQSLRPLPGTEPRGTLPDGAQRGGAPGLLTSTDSSGAPQTGPVPDPRTAGSRRRIAGAPLLAARLRARTRRPALRRLSHTAGLRRRRLRRLVRLSRRTGLPPRRIRRLVRRHRLGTAPAERPPRLRRRIELVLPEDTTSPVARPRRRPGPGVLAVPESGTEPGADPAPGGRRARRRLERLLTPPPQPQPEEPAAPPPAPDPTQDPTALSSPAPPETEVTPESPGQATVQPGGRRAGLIRRQAIDP